jgi:hypothetical protein
MSDTEGQYEDGYGKPPAGRHFQKGQSGNPREELAGAVGRRPEQTGVGHDRRAPAQGHRAGGDCRPPDLSAAGRGESGYRSESMPIGRLSIDSGFMNARLAFHIGS